jgi:hypothetical protein
LERDRAMEVLKYSMWYWILLPLLPPPMLLYISASFFQICARIRTVRMLAGFQFWAEGRKIPVKAPSTSNIFPIKLHVDLKKTDKENESCIERGFMYFRQYERPNICEFLGASKNHLMNSIICPHEEIWNLSCLHVAYY